MEIGINKTMEIGIMEKCAIVIFLILIGLLTYGAWLDHNRKQEDPIKIDIIVYDYCEYVYVQQFRSVLITHKGNCKNPIHKIN